MAYCLAKRIRQCRDPGKVLEKIQRDPFGPEDRAAIPLNVEQRRAGGEPVAVTGMRREPERGIDHQKGLHGRRESGDHQRLLCNDRGLSRYRLGEEGRRGEITFAEVFFESGTHGAADIGGGELYHRSGSQHGTELLFAAHQLLALSIEHLQPKLVFSDHFRWRFPSEFIVA